jgi:hypothetical protein
VANDPVWLPTAKTLAAGRRIRIECCAHDKSLMVSNEVRGYRAYCFRCGPRGFIAHGDFSIDQLRRRREEFALLQEAHVRLPRDFTTEIPPNEAIWLYRAGISAALAKHYGFGYSASLSRVVLPVYTDERRTLVGFTARSTIGAKPKYIERMCSPTAAVFNSDPSVRLPDCMSYSGPDLVVVLRTYYPLFAWAVLRDEPWPCWGRARTSTNSRRQKDARQSRSGLTRIEQERLRTINSDAGSRSKDTRPSPSVPNKTRSSTVTGR